MTQYKYFIQEGKNYKFKPQTGYKLVMTLLLFALSFISWYAGSIFFIFMFGILALMVAATIVTDKFEIDAINKVIHVKSGVFMSPVAIPFNQVSNFEMLTVTALIVRSFVSINLHYQIENGQQKVVKVAQGISKTHMQNVLNEVNEILAQNKQQLD